MASRVRKSSTALAGSFRGGAVNTSRSACSGPAAPAYVDGTDQGRTREKINRRVGPQGRDQVELITPEEADKH